MEVRSTSGPMGSLDDPAEGGDCLDEEPFVRVGRGASWFAAAAFWTNSQHFLDAMLGLDRTLAQCHIKPLDQTPTSVCDDPP